MSDFNYSEEERFRKYAEAHGCGEEKHICYYCGHPAYIRKILIGDDDAIHWLCDECNAKHNAMLVNAKTEVELREELRHYAEAHGFEIGNEQYVCPRPLPCMRDERGEIRRQTVKQLLAKINEELDELKAALFFFSELSIDRIAIQGEDELGIPDKETIAEEAADTITAITTLLAAFGIDEEMRDEAQRRVNSKNRERGRL